MYPSSALPLVTRDTRLGVALCGLWWQANYCGQSGRHSWPLVALASRFVLCSLPAPSWGLDHKAAS